MNNSENNSSLPNEDKYVGSQTASVDVERKENEESDELASASEEAAKKPMSFKAKVCLNTSLSLVFLAVLFAAGVFNHLPSLLFGVIPDFWRVMVSEHPFLTSAVTIGIAFMVSCVLFENVPKSIKPITALPFVGVTLFWLFKGWSSMANQPGSVVDVTSILLVAAACALVGFCSAVHSVDEASWQKIADFVFVSIITNGAAILLCAGISWIVPNEQTYTWAVEKETYATRMAHQIMGACTDFKSKEFCDALTIIEAEIAASK